MRAFIISLLLCFLMIPHPAHADQIHYDLRLAGLRLGSLVYVADTNSAAYATRIQFQTTGLAGFLAQVRFEMLASGRMGLGNTFGPEMYREETTRGETTEITEIRWRGSQPRISIEDPPQPDQLDPRQAQGSVDLATGFHALFRLVPADAACAFELLTYDGKRLTQISVGAPSPGDQGLICEGTVERRAGVAPEGMLDMLSGGFTLRYVETAQNTLQMVEMEMRTPLGRARFTLSD